MFKIFLICLAFIVVYSTTSLCQWDSDQAYKIQTDTSQFDNNLASTETNVQAALDVLDNLTVSGGGVNTTILKDNATVGTQPNVNFNNTATVQWTITNVTADGQIKVTAASTASAAPAGVNQSVQYNDSGSTGGEAAFTYNKDLDMLTVRNWTVADTFSSSAKVDHNTTANYSATFHFLKTEVDHNATENYTAARHLLTSEIDHNTTANYSATYHFTMASVDHNGTTNYDANRHKLESEITHNNTLGYEAQYHFKTTEVPHNTTTGFEANRHLLGTEVVHNTTSGYEAAFHLAVGDIVHNSTSGYEAQYHLEAIGVNNTTHQFFQPNIRFKAGANVSSIVLDNDTGTNSVNVTINTLDTAGSGANATYQNNSVAIGQQGILNLIAGSGISIVGVNDTDGKVNVTFTSTGGAGGGALFREITILPESTVLDDNSPPSISVIESTGAQTPRFRVAAFDAATNESMSQTITMPSDFNLSAVSYADVYWYTDNATAGKNVTWGCWVSATTPADADDMLEQACAAININDGVVDSTEATRLLNTTIILTNNDTWAANDVVTFKFQRVADHANDTAGSDANIVNIRLRLP
uniref:Uncharacterized protein n=1 Tax=viral metagenome TaxID=1070528 RepID=A0A6H1ZPF0_9ZZZZ